MQFVHFWYDRFYFKQYGAPPHFHRYLRAYLDENLAGKWIVRRGAIEFTSFPDLKPLDFYIWGTLKDVVRRKKLATMAVLREETETAFAAIHVDTLVNVAQTVVRRTEKYLNADGNHFGHLL